MKTVSIIAALTITLTNAHARVGETAQEIEARYGKPKHEKQEPEFLVNFTSLQTTG